jgi:hypothetical protein
VFLGYYTAASGAGTQYYNAAGTRTFTGNWATADEITIYANWRTKNSGATLSSILTTPTNWTLATGDGSEATPFFLSGTFNVANGKTTFVAGDVALAAGSEYAAVVIATGSSLVVGANTVVIHVTSEDGANENYFSVTVTRAGTPSQPTLPPVDSDSGGGSTGGGGTTTPATPIVNIPTGDSTVVVPIQQEGETVTLVLTTEKVEEIIDSAQDGKAVLNLSTIAGATEAVLPTAALEQLADADLDVEIRLPQGTIVLDAAAAASAAEQADGADITVSLEILGVSDLSPEQRSAVRGSDVIFDITISSGDKQITNFDGTITVTVPYNGPLPAAVWYLNSAGQLIRIPSTYNAANRTVTFTTTHLSFYVVGLDTAALTPSSWAKDAVEQAIKLGLVPSHLQMYYQRDLNRVEFAALAVRLYENITGGPITEFGTFIDTDDINVLKLAGLGIVQGDGTGRYGPNGVFTREMSITLMYNMMVQLGYEFEFATPAFGDAASIADWAVEAIGSLQNTGVVQGDGVNFNPKLIFTREMGIMTLINFLDFIAKQ